MRKKVNKLVEKVNFDCKIYYLSIISIVCLRGIT